jgi:hypothetical protein
MSDHLPVFCFVTNGISAIKKPACSCVVKHMRQINSDNLANLSQKLQRTAWQVADDCNVNTMYHHFKAI